MAAFDPPHAERRLRLPLIDKRSVGFQFWLLATLFGLALLGLGFFVLMDARAQTRWDVERRAIGDLRALALRMANSAQGALRGAPEASPALKDERERFTQLLGFVAKDGAGNGESVRAALSALQNQWGPSDRAVQLVLAQHQQMGALADLVADINGKVRDAAALAAQARGQVLQQLPLLVERIGRNANLLSLDAEQGESAAPLLAQDLNNALLTADAAHLDALAQLMRGWQQRLAALDADLPAILRARQATAQLGRDGAGLAQATESLAKAVDEAAEARPKVTGIIAALGAVALITLIMMIKLHSDEQLTRTRAAEQLLREAEAAKAALRDAILQLGHDMRPLAAGDLTVRSTVNSDCTGPIADTMNRSVEHLVGLVNRLDDAASRITAATDKAALNLTDMRAASEVQGREILRAETQLSALAATLSGESDAPGRSAQITQQLAAALQEIQRSAELISSGTQDTIVAIEQLVDLAAQLGAAAAGFKR